MSTFSNPFVERESVKLDAYDQGRSDYWHVEMAFTMLKQAKEEQATSNRKNKWLQNNKTLEVIEERVAELQARRLSYFFGRV